MLRRAWKSNKNIKLALELPHKWQRHVDHYMATREVNPPLLFEFGLRRGSNYTCVLDAAADLNVPVLCLDYDNAEDRDVFMAQRIISAHHGGDQWLVYAGGFHTGIGYYAFSRTTCEILRTHFGEDRVYSVCVEFEGSGTEDANFSYNDGLTTFLSRSKQCFTSLAFDLNDPETRDVLYRLNSPYPERRSSEIRALCSPEERKTLDQPWYDHHDAFLYLSRGPNVSEETRMSERG